MWANQVIDWATVIPIVIPIVIPTAKMRTMKQTWHGTCKTSASAAKFCLTQQLLSNF